MSRIITRLRDNWKFTRTKHEDAVELNCDESKWENIQIPHDWAIAGPFDRENDIERKVKKGQLDVEEDVREITGRTGGLPHTGEGWYRLWIDIPSTTTDKVYRLECDGIMSHSEVYCNGKKVGGWPYGYTSFALDLTKFIRPGEKNLLAVYVNNPEKSSRWYPGAGIYRNVRILELNPIHIEHWGVEITTPELSDVKGCVEVKTNIVETSNSVKVRSTIFSPEGKEVINSENNSSELKQTFEIDNPQRWSIEHPFQYTLRSEVIDNGIITDTLETKFGFRTIKFDIAKGFFLNEKPVKMKGVCQHHDLGPLGAAVNRAALKRQLQILQEMGCNAIRTSHNPPDPQLLELASEMGLLVIDEMFDEWKHRKMPNGYHTLWDEWAEKDVRALIKRDRNFPAVIMWSTGNEIPEQGKEDGAEISQFLVDTCHDEDPTRPVTAGLNHFGSETNRALAATLDIPGWNYRPHSYGQIRYTLPDKPTYGSETASTVSSRGEYYFPIKDEIHYLRDTLQVNSYDMSYPGWATSPDTEFQAQEAHPFIMGEFVWTGFDYLGEPTPYSEEWPSRSSYFGIIDLAGIPKDRFYLYQSQWSDKDVLHLMPHWTWPGYEGKKVPVQCYSSYNNVELFVNGVSQGKRGRYEKGRVLENNYRFIWHDVIYEPGELKVIAYDKKGNVVAEESVLTSGSAKKIELCTDQMSLNADGEDMAFVTIRIVDEDGNLCPKADESISFEVEGPAEIIGLCNGDATSIESFKGSQMKAFNGVCVVYLRSIEGKLGEVILKASTENLKENSIRIEVKE